jgi:hypothetical protein
MCAGGVGDLNGLVAASWRAGTSSEPFGAMTLVLDSVGASLTPMSDHTHRYAGGSGAKNPWMAWANYSLFDPGH